MLPLLTVFAPIIDKALSFIPDPNKKAEARLKLQQELDAHSQAILAALVEVDKGQLAVNAEEAKSARLFVAGWRPALGWVCGSAFAWQYVVQPFLAFCLAAAGRSVELPVLDFSAMSPVMMGMLGLAGMRTWEKTQNSQNNH